MFGSWWLCVWNEEFGGCAGWFEEAAEISSPQPARSYSPLRVVAPRRCQNHTEVERDCWRSDCWRRIRPGDLKGPHDAATCGRYRHGETKRSTGTSGPALTPDWAGGLLCKGKRPNTDPTVCYTATVNEVEPHSPDLLKAVEESLSCYALRVGTGRTSAKPPYIDSIGALTDTVNHQIDHPCTPLRIVWKNPRCRGPSSSADAVCTFPMCYIQRVEPLTLLQSASQRERRLFPGERWRRQGADFGFGSFVSQAPQLGRCPGPGFREREEFGRGESSALISAGQPCTAAPLPPFSRPPPRSPNVQRSGPS